MNTRKIQGYLLFAFLFLLPFQTVFLLREVFVDGEKWQYGTIGVYFSDFLLIATLTLFFVRRCIMEKNLSPIIRPVFYIDYQLSLILFLLWSGLSILWAGDRWLAFSSFIILLFAVGLFFLVRSLSVPDIKKAVFILLCAGVIQSGIGAVQFLSQQSIDSSILGMSAHEAFQAGSSVLKIDSGRFLRAYGTFSHPNILGGFSGVILLLSIAYYVLCIRYERSWKMFTDIVFLLVGSMVVFLGLILTFSRSAWLGVVMGILALGVVALLQKERDVRWRFLKILLALTLAGSVFGSLLREQIFPRFDTVTIEREGSVTERVQSLRDAERVIGEGNMVLGTGIGNSTAQMIQMQPGRSVWTIQPAHNVFVLIFAELGIVGFVLFVIFLGGILFQIKSIFQKKENVIFGIALLVLIPSLFLDHFLWSSHFGLFFLFLLLGLVSRR